jgi:NAD(P)-dependent dehydrogenase (short-subunit alcohol dehydrogenase family)
LKKIGDELAETYGSHRVITSFMDVTSEVSIRDTLNLILSKSLRVDVLINNAALNPKVDSKSALTSATRLENMEVDDWDLDLNVGLRGAVLCTKVFGSEMAKDGKGGVILNVASDLSVIAPDQRLYFHEGVSRSEQQVKPVTYSVVKAGLVGLTKYIATYWCEQGVRCNVISPGGVINGQSDDFVEKVSRLIPLGRMAEPNEYRCAVQFLCSDASSYMNGHNLVMDGGRSIW